MLKYTMSVVNAKHMEECAMCCFPSKTSTWSRCSTSMRLVLTHSAQHSAPKRPRPIHSDANHPTGVSFLCFERIRMVKTLLFAPSRSFMDWVTLVHGFASFH